MILQTFKVGDEPVLQFPTIALIAGAVIETQMLAVGTYESVSNTLYLSSV